MGTNGSVILPYKPFTLGEVAAIASCPDVLDDWVGLQEDGKALALMSPEAGRLADSNDLMVGLDWMQAFAVFAGHEWLREGAGPERSTHLVHFLGKLNLEHFVNQLEQGFNFPALAIPGSGIPQSVLVKAPRTQLGQRLRLDATYKKFLAEMRRVFPNG